MNYSRVPEDFMKGIFMAPHSFNDPQNPQHGQYVNMQLRNDLYFSTLHEISNVQFSYLNIGSDQEWIKVQKFNECNPQISWFRKILSDHKKKNGRTLSQNNNRKVQMISCQQWQVALHKGQSKSISNYRVHVLQSDSDIFKTEIFPPNIFKCFKDFLIN